MSPTEPPVGTMSVVVTVRQQRLVTWGLALVATMALVLAIAFQGDRTIEDDEPIVDRPAGAGGDGGATASPRPINPIEGFLPRSGEGSGCQEPVGVDLITGYAATLTINGIRITPEEMNVNLDDDGQISQEITASRSLSQFTFGPEPDCPNGRVLRPTDNVMQACVYRLEDGPESCTVAEYVFDVA